jgi:phosphoglycerate dehydrogenase-like enzyme
MKIQSVWTNIDLSDQDRKWLAKQVSPYELRVSEVSGSNLEEGKGEEACVTASIAFGQPAVNDILGSDSLRWVHLTSAGYTRYDRDDVSSKIKASGIMTNSSSVYDSPCAEHVLAFMLSHNRRILPSHSEHACNREWIYGTLRPQTRILRGQNVLIVGYGAIGRRLAELLQPFGCNVIGIRRKPNGDEAISTFAITELDLHLPWADHVVNILPASDSTYRLFDASKFALLKPMSAFYNIGRGDTVDQDALLAALKSGAVAVAMLDVASPEPLPSLHPLWNEPNCLITPHIAGGLQEEHQALLNHFVENFQRFIAKQALLDQVF